MALKGKILFTASTYGHIRNFHPPYLRQFTERGWRVHVACAGVPERVPYAEKAFALPFKKRIGSPANFRAACTLRRIISAEGYDLISSHTSLASFFTRLALLGMRNRPRLVNTVHGYLFDDETPPLKRSLLLGAERMAAGVTDLLMVMNRTDERIAETYGLGRRIVRIPGVGVNFAAFDAAKRLDKQAVRRELGLPADAFVLLYPAEFSDRKSQRVLIEAMPHLPESVILALPGDGARLEQCRALAEQKRRKILFPGYVTDMGKWYVAADALVSASRSEGLPFHIMEAMNMGLPVIASAVKGNADLIEQGKTGILYPYGNVNLFTADALRLMKDDALRTAMAERAREAVKQYDLNRVLPLVMRQYESVIPPV